MNRERGKNKISMRLGTKSILAVVLLLSTISITLSWFFVSSQRTSLTDELRKRAFSLASNLSFNSQYAVLSGDNETLQSLISGVVKESDIEDAVITDLAGVVLAERDTAGVGRTIAIADELDSLVSQKWIDTGRDDLMRTITLIDIEKKPADSDEILLSSSPGETSDGSTAESNAAYREKLGFVILEVSLESMNQALSAGTRRAFLIALIMILAGALAATYMVRSVALPISRLADAARGVAEEDLDQSVPLGRTDEIGILANAFNDMIGKLKISREKIEAWNRELEGKVAERTKELEAKHKELEKAYEALKTLDKAKDDFLSLVSHEFRTPLSSILLYSEMLLDGVVDSKESNQEFLSSIVENCYRLTRLINDVLDLSKIEAGRMPFNLEKLNFSTLVSDTLAGIRPTIESKNITFEYFETELSLWGDRDKVIQVLTNTISNAVKFTPEGGKITVDISLQPGQGKVSIRDTGKGIKKEDIPKVFDRFKQLENIDHHSTGTGLGMTISKSIIERLGGKIWIESEFGKGTTVNFTLPLAERMAENQS